MFLPPAHPHTACTSLVRKPGQTTRSWEGGGEATLARHETTLQLKIIRPRISPRLTGNRERVRPVYPWLRASRRSPAKSKPAAHSKL